MYKADLKDDVAQAEPEIKAAPGQPHPIDQHVGAQIRLRRRMLGISQEKLADRLGLTFQQVQKYERGHNRVSASKLFQISQVLETDVSHFFKGVIDDDQTAETTAPHAFTEFLAHPDGLELVQLWPKVPLRGRRKILGLVRVLADVDDE